MIRTFSIEMQRKSKCPLEEINFKVNQEIKIQLSLMIK